MSDIQKKKIKWKKVYRFLKKRDLYVPLYAIKLSKDSENTKEMQEKIESIEKEMPYETIIEFRTLASHLQNYWKKTNTNPKKKSGMIMNFFESYLGTKKLEKEEKIEVSLEAWKIIYKKVSEEKETKPKVLQNPKFINLDLKTNFPLLAFSLESPENKKIAQFKLFQFKNRVIKRETSSSLYFNLNSIELIDYFSYKNREIVLIKSGEMKKDLVDLNINFDPLDSPNLEIEIFLKTKSIDILFSKILIDELERFFSPKNVSKLVELRKETKNVYESLVNYSNQVDLASATKGVNIDIKAEAPNIIIAQDWENFDHSPKLILILGELLFWTPFYSDSSLEKANQDLIDPSFYSKYYREHRMILKNSQIFMSNSADWKSEKIQILFPLKIKIDIHNLILKNDSFYQPVIEVSLDSPLKGKLSLNQLYVILNIVDKIISPENYVQQEFTNQMLEDKVNKILLNHQEKLKKINSNFEEQVSLLVERKKSQEKQFVISIDEKEKPVLPTLKTFFRISIDQIELLFTENDLKFESNFFKEIISQKIDKDNAFLVIFFFFF